VDHVGGWGEASQQQTRIKERRIVLCLDDKGTTYKPPTGRVAGAGGSSGSAVTEGKVKFRRLNNGAGELQGLCLLGSLFCKLSSKLCSCIIAKFTSLALVTFFSDPLDASLAASALASIKTDTSTSITGTTSASSAAKTGTASTSAGKFSCIFFGEDPC